METTSDLLQIESVFDFAEVVDLRYVALALKVLKFDYSFDGDDDEHAALLKSLYSEWLVSDRHKKEKDLAMMILFEETIIEEEINEQYLMSADELEQRDKRNREALDRTWEKIRERQQEVV